LGPILLNIFVNDLFFFWSHWWHTTVWLHHHRLWKFHLNINIIFVSWVF
jgi:hypothetical protein